MGSNFANFVRFRPLTYARAQLSLPPLMGDIYVISRREPKRVDSSTWKPTLRKTLTTRYVCKVASTLFSFFKELKKNSSL